VANAVRYGHAPDFSYRRRNSLRHWVGWGIFNFVEGIVDHEILGIHHVNETVSETKRPYWDLAFLLWGLAMIGAGWALMSRGKRESGTWDARHST
jgi:uncharacterized membrane protein